MALPKMQRVLAAAAVAALLTAGAPGRAEAAGTGAAGSTTDAWASAWDWVLSQLPPVLRLWLGEDEGQGNGNGNGNGRGHRPGAIPPPPDVDKGSGLDPNGGGDD